MAVESRRDLASRHGRIVRIATGHSWSYRSDNPICTRTVRPCRCVWFKRQEYEPRGKAAAEIELVYKFMSKLINSLAKEGEQTDGKANRRLKESHA